MSDPAQTGPTRIDVESAIMEAEGAAAVVTCLEAQLASSLVEGWKRLHLVPRDDLRVRTLSPDEHDALTYATRDLTRKVAEVARVFYAALEARSL